MKYFLFTLPILLLAALVDPAQGQSSVNELYTNTEIAIQNSNAQALSRYLASKVELTLLEKKGRYSKSQTQQLLKKFMEDYPVDDFRYVHKGSTTKGVQYAIAKYFSGEHTFRVYMLIKEEDGAVVLETLDISEK